MPEKSKAAEMPGIFMDEINFRTTSPYNRSNQ